MSKLVRSFSGAVHAAGSRLASLAAVCVVCSAAAVSTAQTLEPGETLTLAIGPIVPPLFYFDDRGQASGFVPELLREAGRRANVEIAFELIPDLSTLNSLDPEDYPLVTWLLAEEHPEGYTMFQRGYLTLHARVFQRESGAYSEDIPAYKLGELITVANTEVEHDLLNNAWDGIIITPTHEEAFRLLASGKHDSVIVSEFMGMGALESLGIDSIVRVTSTEMHMHQHVHLLRPRYRTDIERAFAPAFISIRQDGTFDRLHAKWFGKYEQRNVSLRTYRTTTVGIATGAAALALVLLLSRRRLRRLLSWQGAALETSQSRLGDLLQNAKAVVWEASLDAQFSYVSPYAETLLGYPHADWFKPDFFSNVLLHPEDRDEVVRVCRSATLKGEDHALDYRVRSASGEVLWLHDIVKVVKDAAGRPLRLHGVMIDITSVRQAQQAAAESESRLSAIMKASPTGIVRLDITGRVTFGNEEAARITGLRGGEVDRTRWLNAIHPEDREAVKDAWRRIAHEPSSDLREYRFMHTNGDVVWVLDRGHPETDAQGTITGYVATLTDITQIKLAEETIRTHSQVLMQLTEAVNFTDINGTILYTNAAFDEMFGYAPGELIGKDVSTLNHVSQDIYQRLSTEIGAALRTSGSWVGEFRNRHRTGSEFWTRARVFQIQGGRLAVCVQEDVTDRKRAEAALRESEALFRAITEHMPDAVFLLDYADPDAPGVVAYANDSAARMHGIPVEELLGRSVAELTDPSTAHLAAGRRTRLLSGETVRFEGVRRRADGSTFPVEVVASRIEALGAGKVLSIDRDLTERRRLEDERLAMEQRMLQAQKLESLGILAGGIAHDFNNLLVGILGHADLARESLDAGSAARDNLEQIEVAAHRAAELTHQMLAYSGRGRFVVRRVHLDIAVREMAKLLEISLSKKAVLRFELEPDTPPIEADSAQIQQVVMNLITNASDALEDKTGVITLRTGVSDYDAAALGKFTLGEPLAPGRYVYLEVTDTGCGMDPATLQRMFDPFFSTKFAGRGLGLASVIGIVRSHHGGLHVSSRSGAGTSFRVIIPEASCETHAVPRGEANGEHAAGRGGVILVVDDEPRVLDLIARALERCHYEVVTAEDGRTALEKFAQHRANVRGVIIDWTMPEMNGVDVLAAIRAERPLMPALFISGYAASETAGRIPNDGRSAFLQKPFTIERLRRIVDEMVGTGLREG